MTGSVPADKASCKVRCSARGQCRQTGCYVPSSPPLRAHQIKYKALFANRRMPDGPRVKINYSYLLRPSNYKCIRSLNFYTGQPTGHRIPPNRSRFDTGLPLLPPDSHCSIPSLACLSYAANGSLYLRPSPCSLDSTTVPPVILLPSDKHASSLLPSRQMSLIQGPPK